MKNWGVKSLMKRGTIDAGGVQVERVSSIGNALYDKDTGEVIDTIEILGGSTQPLSDYRSDLVREAESAAQTVRERRREIRALDRGNIVEANTMKWIYVRKAS